MTNTKAQNVPMTGKQVRPMPRCLFGFGLGSNGARQKMTTVLIGAAMALAIAACSFNTVATSTVSPTTAAMASPSSAAVAAPTAASMASPVATTAATPSVGTSIVITIGDRTITATLNDSAAARDFAASLPRTLPGRKSGNIEIITVLPAPLTETGPFYTSVQSGDLVYWNPEDHFTMIFKPTSSPRQLTKLGEITSDLSVFDQLPANVEIRIEAR